MSADTTQTPPHAANDRDRPPAATTGQDLIDKAAEGLDLTGQEAGDLFDYWLGNGGLPGHEKPTERVLKLGAGESARSFPCSYKRIAWEEQQAAVESSRDKESGEQDVRLMNAYICAYGLVTPDASAGLAKLLATADDDGKVVHPKTKKRVKAPEDPAHFLTWVLADEPGALLELGQEIMKLSKLSQYSDRSVVARKTAEVEAGKG